MKYEIAFPVYTTELDFSFNTVVKEGTFDFRFRWYASRWHGWATLPSGEVRSFGVFPNTESWTGFVDYGITIETSRAIIGYADLADCLVVLEVKP
jgi:hypothetical protein